MVYCNFMNYLREKGAVREGGEREETDIGLLSHLFMHSLVDSWMCPDLGLNSQPQHIRTTL